MGVDGRAAERPNRAAVGHCQVLDSARSKSMRPLIVST
jgi:hypothetical protein